MLSLPRVADSLAGRVEVLHLWPLSEDEVRGSRSDFAAALFGVEASSAVPVDEEEIISRIASGGYPDAIGRTPGRRRTAWFEAYVITILQRDVRDLANIEGIRDAPRLLQLLAGRTSMLANAAALARESGLSQTTLRRYLGVLQAVYLLHYQSAWATNYTKKVTRSPKTLLNDTGLAAHLINVDAARLRSDRKLLGQLLKAFVVLELSKQLGWSEVRARIHDFRDYVNVEVDTVLERPDGSVAAVEVKAAASVTAKDFAGLRVLQDGLGKRFVRGVVLYLGENAVPFGNKLWALPVTALWG